MPLSRHNNLLAFGTETVTGVKAGINPGLNRIESVVPVVDLNNAATKATEANKAVVLTIEVAADKKTFTVYAWKHTSTANPTLIAATAAVVVDYIAVGE